MKRILFFACLIILSVFFNIDIHAQQQEKARIDYEALLKDIHSIDFSIADCIKYIEKYPGYEYCDTVSDIISLYYCSILTPSSPANAYTEALSYASSDEVKATVEKRISELKNMSREIRGKFIWEGRIRIGAGIQYEMWRNTVFGPKAEFRIGRNDDLLNASIGCGVMFWNARWTKSGEYDYIRICRIPILMTIKVNVLHIKKANLFIVGETAYWFNLSAPEYIKSTGEIFDPDESCVNKFLSATGKIGIGLRSFEAALYFSYDLQPPINQKLIYESPYFDYAGFGASINDRFRIGISLMFYITL